MRAQWPSRRRRREPDTAWVAREFLVRSLVPPHCTPEALAQALERERHITIVFRSYMSNDPGVYRLLSRPKGQEDTYIILFRATQSLILRRLTMFHELAHLLFNHPLTEVGGEGVLRGYMVTDADDAMAEAFAIGAMEYSFYDTDGLLHLTDREDDVSQSAFGHFLRRTESRP